jgi:hypothetical protein
VSRPNRIPSYRLHKPTNQANVVIRGKMFYLGRFGSVESRAEYNRIIADWLAGNPQYLLPTAFSHAVQSDLTVAELILAYHRHSEQYYVKNGEVTNQVTLIRLALWV